MTLQRMAREDSPDTLSASQEFQKYLDTVRLSSEWTRYNWKGNIFRTRKEKKCRILIEYEEYRTENSYGIYTFNKEGKLTYFLTTKQKASHALSEFSMLFFLITSAIVFIGFPITAIILAQPSLTFWKHVTPYIPYVIPYILCLLPLIGGIILSKDSYIIGSLVWILSMCAIFIIVYKQFGHHFILNALWTR